MKSDEEIIDQVIRWHVNDHIDQMIMRGLTALMRMGFAEEEKVQADPLGYIRSVCNMLAATVGSMPAVQRALVIANPGYDQTECCNELVRGLAKAFLLDEEAVLAAVKPTPSRPHPGTPNPPTMPPGPVN